jgi:tetratricopeptide (TPR) repeat protein
MSPEQARGEEVDARTDLFSFGLVLYEMATGRPAFARDSTIATLDAILHDAPAAPLRLNPTVAPEFERIIDRSLEKDRELRYQTAAEVRAELRRLRRATETQLGPAGASLPRGPRHRRWLTRGVPAAVVAATIGGAMFWLAPRAPALSGQDEIIVSDFTNTTNEPVFDDTLKQALTVQLRQSPFLNIVSDDRIRETLRFMGRPPQERLTGAVAREVCSRENAKAMVAGAIASLGSQYVITLDAVNCVNGESLEMTQVPAGRKEDVLSALSSGASDLRKRLGESLASIQKFDVPVERATTSSLDALKAFTTGLQLHSSGQPDKAIPHLERAVQLDPGFAAAYAQIGTSYSNQRDMYRAREFTAKAYGLRERVSERERFYIEARYHDSVSGDVDQGLKVYELWTRTYPRDSVPWNNIGVLQELTGDFERALDSFLEAQRLNPGGGIGQDNVALSYAHLNRMAEAKKVAEEAASRFPNLGLTRFIVACREGDDARTAELLKDGREKHVNEILQGAFMCALRNGRFAEARDLRADALPGTRGLAEMAFAEWHLGDRARAKELVIEAARQSPEAALPVRLGSLFATVGEADRARLFVAHRVREQPTDTLLNGVWVPLTEAILALGAHKPDAAIEALRTSERYERRWPEGGFHRGAAYMQSGNFPAAVAQFKRLTDREPEWPPSVTVYPAAMLALARAHLAAGDTAAARQAYQRFLDFWKHADANLVALIEARRELAALR